MSQPRSKSRAKPPTASRRATDADTPDQLADFVEKTQLVGVRFTKVSGVLEVDDPGQVGGLEFTVRPQMISAGQELQCRFATEIRVLDAKKKDLATLDVDTIATFKLTEDADPSRELMQEYMREVAFFIVYPYVRETVQSLSVRLGLGALTLGLLRLGSHGPETTTFSVSPLQSTTRGGGSGTQIPPTA